MSTTVWILLLLGGCTASALVALSIGRASSASRERERIAAALRRVAEGGAPPDDEAGALVAEGLREGWISRPGPSLDEVRVAAVQRVVAFLRGAVAEPIVHALEGGVEGARAELEDAVGALQDLEFHAHLREPQPARADLTRLAREVVREFVADSSATVKEVMPAGSIPVLVDRQGFMDAVYLVLHNAAEFGGSAAITVTVLDEPGNPSLLIRDRGPGFDPEAFRRAMDPFYSTSATGLGLGLARARQLLESMDCEIVLRNHPEGGAEVAIHVRRVA